MCPYRCLHMHVKCDFSQKRMAYACICHFFVVLRPSRKRVPAEGTVASCRTYAAFSAFFCFALLCPALIIIEPKFYLREYEPRKNSGIRGMSLRTEGAFGNAVFKGLHTPRSALRLFNNREILFRPAKKCAKTCVYAIFVVLLQRKSFETL